MAQLINFPGTGAGAGAPTGGGTIPPMDTRVAKLETDLVTVATRLDSELKHLATKADLSSLESSLIKWIVATMIAVSALAFAVARFISPAEKTELPPINITVQPTETPKPAAKPSTRQAEKK